jgi:hypothetical protein
MLVALALTLGVAPAAPQDSAGGGKDQLNIQLFERPITAATHQASAQRPIGPGGLMLAKDCHTMLPTFAGRLGASGRLQLAGRGAESMGMDTPTKAVCDFRFDAPVVVMKWWS